ncbi:MAG: HAMP domain-containing histidine kinase [Polyangiaceae bacterium]|nr:HAMP domain-containing histidine kinase [Polyangiaceae bacterium]
MRRRGPRGTIAQYVRARLHRRLFLWFGATIVLTALLVVGVTGLVERAGNSGWRREYARVQDFVGNRFARAWDAPADRDELARALARDLETDLALTDAEGRVIASYGAPCGPRALRAPVRRGGIEIGAVLLCPDRARRGAPLRLIAPLLVVAGVLWAASGVLSRRLARPLSELARVAREIGEGKLSSRVRLDCRRHGEAGIVGEALNDMAARIERQLHDQRELLAAVSHELRTPLARIRLLTEMAREAGPRAATFDDLDREVMEIDALVGDLLASSRLDFAALAPSRLDPAEVALRAVERAGLDPGLLEVEGGAPPFEADPTLLARALANMIDNARAHGGGIARVRVRAVHIRGSGSPPAPYAPSPAPSGVAFEVEDSGPGFADGDEARAFEAFYRRDRAGGAGRERGSLGLGLALCKRIAEAHGGRAFAENREGGGARVGIEIALRPPAREGV